MLDLFIAHEVREWRGWSLEDDFSVCGRCLWNCLDEVGSLKEGENGREETSCEGGEEERGELWRFVLTVVL
jgi:hypothetical protein